MRNRSSGWVVCAGLVAMLFAAPGRAQVLRAELDVSRTIAAGWWLAIHVDPVAGTATLEDPTARELSAEELAAIAAVPAWLAADLAAAFYRLAPTSNPVEFANMILEAEDPATVDEIGFLIAHLALEDLRRMGRGIIPETARGIYELDAEIAFADLVEHGEPTDPDRYTTVAYKVLRDGTEETYELPRDVYYWDVVHPSLDGEDIVYKDPLRHRVAVPPAGKHWRSYLWTDDPDASYQAADVLVAPNRVTAATFTAWALAGRPRAFSHFENLEVGPIELVRADTGEPVAIAFTRGDQSCGNNDRPNADGMYFATLAPLELAASTGQGQLLTNFVRAGGGNDELLASDITVWDSMTLEARSVLIIRDRMPFDLATDPTEEAVTSFGRPVDVLTSAELDALVLSTDAAPFLNTTYNKIIIPSDQPRALYEALVRNTEKLERFVDYGGMLELHGATRAADDWSDLRLPGGIHCAAQDGTHAHETLAPYGYPLLPDVVASAPYLWDFEPHMGLPGDRPFDEAETALERLGWWVSQNLTWNIQEKVCWKRGAVYARYLLPQEIVFDHFGNCGELQDVWTGGGRTLLVGLWNVGTLADDHMWNEFWQGEQFLPLQVDWSDNDTRIGNWGVAYDADTGGSKTIAAMDGFRGDGLMEPVLARYADTELDGHLWNDYSHHVTLEATVVDNDGNPVDGAQVMIATPGLYDPASLGVATWQATGPDGVARITVGEGNDYYVQINSSLGSYPDATHVDAWLTAAETVADGVFARTFTLDAALAPPAFSVVPTSGEVTGRAAATISVAREIVLGRNFASEHTSVQPYDSGDVQTLLLTESEYANFTAGGAFATVAAGLRGRELAVDEELLGNGPFVLVVANQARVATEQETAIHFELYGPAGADAGDGEDVVEDGTDGIGDVPDEGGPIIGAVSGGGCGCAVAGATGDTAWALGVLGLVLACAFRRRRDPRGRA